MPFKDHDINQALKNLNQMENEVERLLKDFFVSSHNRSNNSLVLVTFIPCDLVSIRKFPADANRWFDEIRPT